MEQISADFDKCKFLIFDFCIRTLVDYIPRGHAHADQSFVSRSYKSSYFTLKCLNQGVKTGWNILVLRFWFENGLKFFQFWKQYRHFLFFGLKTVSIFSVLWFRVWERFRLFLILQFRVWRRFWLLPSLSLKVILIFSVY